MLVQYIQGGPATATEELAVGPKPRKGGKTKDRESQKKKELKEWERHWGAASSSPKTRVP